MWAISKKFGGINLDHVENIRRNGVMVTFYGLSYNTECCTNYFIEFVDEAAAKYAFDVIFSMLAEGVKIYYLEREKENGK